MNTDRDLRLFVLPLAMIPLWIWVNANGGAAHLPKGSLAPLVYAVVTVLGYLLLCRWWFPMDKNIQVPASGGHSSSGC